MRYVAAALAVSLFAAAFPLAQGAAAPAPAAHDKAAEKPKQTKPKDKTAAKPKPAAKKPQPAAEAPSQAAEAAKAQTPPPAQQTPPAPEAAKATEPPPPAKLDRAEIVKRANAFFNASPVMIADFVQIGGDGKRAEGKLYVQRAGRLRFEYAAPATLELVSDGAQVLIRDRKLKSQTLYFIDQTPLKFLMKEKIDLERDAKLVDTAVEDSGVHVLLEDRMTFGGLSKIQLVFDPKSFKLTQWRITDPQGNETQLSLYNIDQKTTPDPTLFKLDAAKND